MIHDNNIIDNIMNYDIDNNENNINYGILYNIIILKKFVTQFIILLAGAIHQ